MEKNGDQPGSLPQPCLSNFAADPVKMCCASMAGTGPTTPGMPRKRTWQGDFLVENPPSEKGKYIENQFTKIYLKSTMYTICTNEYVYIDIYTV